MTYHRHERSHRTQDQPPREVELKLAVPEGSVDALEAYLRARAADAGNRGSHEVTTYFDTADRVLQRGGMSLRVRSAGGTRMQTVKADRQDSVAADRAEWEWPVKQDKPDLRLAERVLDERGLPQNLDLEPVFRTEVDRTTRVLNLDGGTVIETAYDEGLIMVGNSHQRIHELELELRGGEPTPLYRLACELHAAAPVMFETESKGARGYRLANGTKPQMHKSKNTSLKPQTSSAEAFRQIVNAGLGHLLANQAAGLVGDAEGVHQMRIAIRRLRAALALFQPFLELHAAALAERLTKGKRLDLAPAVGVLAEQLGRRRNDALSHLAKRWDAFSGQSRFWG